VLYREKFKGLKGKFMAPRPKSSTSRSPSEVSGHIRALRKKYALTQESLAEVLGVSFASINRWENDQTKPTALALEKLHKLEASLSADDAPSASGPDGAPDNIQTDFTASPAWPCSPADASKVKLLRKREQPVPGSAPLQPGIVALPPTMRAYRSTITINQLQDAGDIAPELLRIQQTWDTQVKVDISFTIGKEDVAAPEDAVQALKDALNKVSKNFE
jgi:transcriptional regulator with XRE-family HTH domain